MENGGYFWQAMHCYELKKKKQNINFILIKLVF